jgi:RNA polymerase sigma-70 factor (ECF subfamily)
VERDLVIRAQRGDREAFAQLVTAHANRLMAVAHRILRDVPRAEDAVQHALVTAWRELPRLRDPDAFEAWLQRVLVNASYAEARRWKAWNANIRVLPLDGPAGTDQTLPLDQRDRLERAMRRLPADQRAILVLTYYAGQTPAEIAQRLGIPAGTARSKLHRAHQAMRAAIEADDRQLAVAGGTLE